MTSPRTAGIAFVLVTAGIYYAVLAFALFPPAALWSGDAGLKLVQLESLLHQDLGTLALVYPGAEFDSNGAAWPFPPPFAVERSGRFYSTFPPYFSIATVPFYKVFGMAGLRALPFLGGIGVLVAGWCLLRQLCLPATAELTGLVLLAFGSPIAFYAATFWEHTPAAALCTVALALVGGILASTEGDMVGPAALAGAGVSSGRGQVSLSTSKPLPGNPGAWFLAGACCGLAFALRMESLIFAGALAGAMLWGIGIKCRSLAALGYFVVGFAVPAGIVIGLNLWWFGHPLGLFEPHFVENPAGRFEIVWEMLVDWNPSLWKSDGLLPLFPVVVVGLVPMIRPGRFSRLVRFHALVGVGFLAAMLLVAPNAGGKQFGPRYLLLGLPPLYVAAAAAMGRVGERASERVGSAGAAPRGPRTLARFVHLLVVVFIAVSIARGFQGAWRLWEEKHGIEGPMLREAAASPARVIVASHPYFPQQAASLYFEKTILRLPLEPGYMPDLSDAGFLFEAAKRGVEQVLYVDDFRFPRVRSFPLRAGDGRRLRVEVDEPTVVGHYRFQTWRFERR